MNFTKKVLFLSLLVSFAICGSSNCTMAQTTPDSISQERPKRNKGKKANKEAFEIAYAAMLDSLNLTAQQREDLDFINTKYRAQMQQLRQNSKGDFAAMRPAMKGLREKQSLEIQEVLSEDQFAKYQKWMTENRQKRRRR